MTQSRDELPDDVPTVMLRNMPVRYTAEELLAELLFEEFKGSFVFLYLPIDFSTKTQTRFCVHQLPLE